MATGSGPLGENLSSPGTSNITPTYAVPDMAQGYERAADAFSRLIAPVQEALDRRAALAGVKAGSAAADQVSKDVEAGNAPAKISESHWLGAYSDAFNQATLARLKTDIDNHDEILKGKFQYDPAGYKDAASKALSGFIQGAPENLAVQVESYGQTKFAGSFADISRIAEQAAAKDAAHALGVRIKSLDERLLGLAATPGGLQSDEFARADAERSLLQIERTRNPVLTYTAEDQTYDDGKLYDSLHGAAAASAADSAYGDAGGGLPGKAAAYRVLENEILKGDALKDADPARRRRIYADARKQIDDFSRADIELQQQQAAEERANRAEQREKVGSLRLAVMLGEIGEKEINANPDLTDADKASLIAGVRAEARRQRTEARMAAAAEKAGRAEIYREYSDQAAAGTISDGDIADAIHAGNLTPGQARTLAAKRDRSLKPVIDDVMAPVKDMASRPGHRASNEKLAQAEEQATNWARQNPNAALTDRLKQGEAIGKLVFGAKGHGPTSSGPNAARAAQAAKLKSDFSAGRISRGQYNDGMKALLNGH